MYILSMPSITHQRYGGRSLLVKSLICVLSYAYLPLADSHGNLADVYGNKALGHNVAKGPAALVRARDWSSIATSEQSSAFSPVQQLISSNGQQCITTDCGKSPKCPQNYGVANNGGAFQSNCNSNQNRLVSGKCFPSLISVPIQSLEVSIQVMYLATEKDGNNMYGRNQQRKKIRKLTETTRSAARMPPLQRNA